MTDTFSEEEILQEYGDPVFRTTYDGNLDREERISQDICEEYMVFLDEKYNAGCLVFGKTRRGWIRNNNVRYLVTHLINLNLQLQEEVVQALEEGMSMASGIEASEDDDDSVANMPYAHKSGDNPYGDNARYGCDHCGLELFESDVGHVAAGNEYANGEFAPCPKCGQENLVDRDTD